VDTKGALYEYARWSPRWAVISVDFPSRPAPVSAKVQRIDWPLAGNSPGDSTRCSVCERKCTPLSAGAYSNTRRHASKSLPIS